MIYYPIQIYQQTMLTRTDTNIAINYVTAKHAVQFEISFGEGKDEEDEKKRKQFTKNYDVEVFESGEGDEYAKGYRVITNEGPLVIKLDNIRIQNENSKYDYAIGFALDNEEPEYLQESSTIPINIKRDGTLWTLQANTGSSYNIDQNPNAKYQWMVRRALEGGYKPTEEELKLGMEETTQNSGLVYLTFMVYHKPKFEYEPVTRGGATRSISRGSSAARFGYGNEVESASVKSTYEHVSGTERYVLPIRLRVSDESATSNINCSQHLEGASLNALRRKTMTVPF
jgi:hypothetical protein